jgi:sporulation protein YlmC with PRC-barrel domain
MNVFRRAPRVVVAAFGLLLALSGLAAAQSSGASIVEEALQGVRQDQQRDSERVRRMVDEAVKGAEQAPSGQDTVNPGAPATLRPLAVQDAPGVLPVGYRVDSLVDRPVDDGSGARIGRIRDLVLDETSGVARAMVEFQPLFGHSGKTSVVPIESLSTATARGEGYVMELTAVEFERMPAYTRQGPVWRRAGG